MFHQFIKTSLITLFVAILLLGLWEVLGVDVEAGQRLADNHCGVCHNLTSARLHEKGPYLWGVVGRKAGSAGFNYSDAFRAKVEAQPFVWDGDTLNDFLKSPETFLAGTRMTQQLNKHTLAFSGIADRQNRKNLIAYLKTLH